MWWERRRISREEIVQNLARSSQTILAMAMNFSKSCKRALGIRRYGWENPPHGLVKLNVDAAYSADYFAGAPGAILQDDQGMFIVG
jgi:hypothetical protein